jgi:hypothetical protein
MALAALELRALGARRLESMSKYCLGVVLVHGHTRGNSLLPVLRHCDARRAPVAAMKHRQSTTSHPGPAPHG